VNALLVNDLRQSDKLNWKHGSITSCLMCSPTGQTLQTGRIGDLRAGWRRTPTEEGWSHHLSGILPLGIPVEDLPWYLYTAALWGTYYKFASGGRVVATRRAAVLAPA
jgi:hypothetical protein